MVGPPPEHAEACSLSHKGEHPNWILRVSGFWKWYNCDRPSLRSWTQADVFLPLCQTYSDYRAHLDNDTYMVSSSYPSWYLSYKVQEQSTDHFQAQAMQFQLASRRCTDWLILVIESIKRCHRHMFHIRKVMPVVASATAISLTVCFELPIQFELFCSYFYYDIIKDTWVGPDKKTCRCKFSASVD